MYRYIMVGKLRKTMTTPEELKGGTMERPDVVRSLLQYGTDTQHELPLSIKRLWMGSDPDKCGIVIPSAHVSAQHCELVRRRKRLRVADAHSKNGTWVEGVREESFWLKPGEKFTVGALPYRFIALSDQMRAVYPELVDILGAEDEHVLRSDTPSPSDLIVSAIDSGHLLVTSDRDCGQERLAQIIHEISRLRVKPLVELDDIYAPAPTLLGIAKRDAARSTLVLNLGEKRTPLASSFVSTLFSAPHRVRVIALARSEGVANKALGAENVSKMKRLWIRPLALRSAAIPRLLDHELEQRKTPLRFSHMTPENRRAIQSYGWPENFGSLRQAAEYLAAIVRTGSPNQAALALGIAPSSFYHWYTNQIGLKGTTPISVNFSK